MSFAPPKAGPTEPAVPAKGSAEIDLKPGPDSEPSNMLPSVAGRDELPTVKENEPLPDKNDEEIVLTEHNVHPNATASDGKAAAPPSYSPDPALRVEYTDRLLQEYNRLQQQNEGVVSLELVADAIQYSESLLQSLQDCAQWDSRSRFETYRDVYVALHMEKDEQRGSSKSAGQDHSLSFEEFQSIFPGPKASAPNIAPMEQKQRTPTPEELEDVEGQFSKDKRLIGRLAAVPRKEIPKHSLRDRIREAHSSGILHLSGCGLKYFPGDGEFVHYLRQVKVLSLSRNQLTSLPSELAYLPHVEHLNLSSNLLEKLPGSISSMTHLKSLDVSNNALQFLPPELGNLKNIEILCANKNQIQSLPYSLGKLKTLHRFDMKGNPMYPVLWDKYNDGLPTLLSFLQAISTCVHEARILGNSPYGVLETEEDIFKNEQVLSQADFGMVGTVVDTRREIINNRLNSARETKSLTLEYINLVEVSDEMVVPDVISLQLSHNKRLTEMPENIKQFPHLVRLSVKKCGIQSISESCGLGNLLQLESLDISSNQLEILPGGTFANLQNLKLLDVSGNKLVRLPIELSRLKSLKTFLFHGNPLPNLAGLRALVRESGIPGIQSEIVARAKGYVSTVDTEDIERSTLSKRYDLADYTSVLDLSSCGLATVPDEAVASKYYGKLTEIILARNQVQKMPDKMANMYRLRRLDISRNDLSNYGLPAEMMNLKSLVQLDISHNRFEEFPTVILEFNLLRSLNISHNKMKAVPLDLRNLKKLEFLAIEGNPLPKNFTQELRKGILDFMELLENLAEKLPPADPLLKVKRITEMPKTSLLGNTRSALSPVAAGEDPPVDRRQQESPQKNKYVYNAPKGGGK
jgi:Leucine-rich repeat (LRR) protein